MFIVDGFLVIIKVNLILYFNIYLLFNYCRIRISSYDFMS